MNRSVRPTAAKTSASPIVPTVSGYSSLQSQRHFEYWSSVDRQKDVLLDLWNVGYLVTNDPPTDVGPVGVGAD